MKFFSPLLIAALTGCAIPRPGAFYSQAVDPADKPGTLIAAQPFTPTVPGAAAYRVLYASTDIHGADVPVSGVVYIPLAPAPAGGRDTVAWAHPTTGIAPGCAPSIDTGGVGGISLADSIPGLADFIAAGDIVAATDYQGMGASAPGVAGIHPYLIGVSEGHGILDSVRAAAALPGATENGRFVVWGHSQGGQAALFAGELAAAYAPELKLLGVAAAAPPTDMRGEFAEPFKSDGGRLLGAYVYTSWSKIYDVPLDSVVIPGKVPAAERAAQQCIATLGQGINALRAASALDPDFLSRIPADTPPWDQLFDENSPGRQPPGAPLLIVQGGKDPTVEPHWAESFTARACAKHEIVQLTIYKNSKHLLIAYKAKPEVTAWIASRFAGAKPPNSCPA